MQKTLTILAVFIALLTACGEDLGLRKDRIGKLTDRDQTVLLAINEIQNDNIAARQDSGHGFLAAPVSEKVAKMSERMRKPYCVHNAILDDHDDLSGETKTQTINGTDCPVYWFRERGFDRSSGVWHMRDKLVVLNEDFRKLSGMKMRTVAGDYGVRKVGGVTTISGDIALNDFELTEYGKITGNIRTDQRYDGDEGSGSIVFRISSPMMGSHRAEIHWNVRRTSDITTTYLVDSVRVEKKEFEQLFSSFELSKIMDNSLDMK